MTRDVQLLQERVTQLELLLVLLIDQLDYAFPGNNMMSRQRPTTPDWSGMNTHGAAQCALDTHTGQWHQQIVSTQEEVDFARARFENIRARITALREQVKP